MISTWLSGDGSKPTVKEVLWSVVGALAVLVAGYFFVHQPMQQDDRPAGASHLYLGQPPEVSDMLRSMRDATPQEVAQLIETDALPVWNRQGRVYVATGDITLVPTLEHFAVVLPHQFKWVAGDLGKATVIRPFSGGGAYPYYDVLCALEALGKAHNCTSELQRIYAKGREEWKPRKATPEERKLVAGLESNQELLVAEGVGALFASLRTAPLVLLASGAKALGGRVGFTRLFVPGMDGGTELMDMFCWIGGRFAGTAELAHDPATFIPRDSRHYDTIMDCREHSSE